MSCPFLHSNFPTFIDLVLFTGILGYDVFLDEHGDVQQNLTVMTFSYDTGKTAAVYTKLKKRCPGENHKP